VSTSLVRGLIPFYIKQYPLAPITC